MRRYGSFFWNVVPQKKIKQPPSQELVEAKKWLREMPDTEYSLRVKTYQRENNVTASEFDNYHRKDMWKKEFNIK